jgi:hypothetical protein
MSFEGSSREIFSVPKVEKLKNQKSRKFYLSSIKLLESSKGEKLKNQ